MALPVEVKSKAVALRKAGYGMHTIAERLAISTGTIHQWLKDIPRGTYSSEEILVANREAWRRNGITARLVRTSNQHAERAKAYSDGKASEPSALDGLCIGLYWGEGGKTRRQWLFSNSDREAVRQMLDWAVRAGQAQGAFTAQVQVHPGDTITDKEIKEYWAIAGIRPDAIGVYRIRSSSSKQVLVGRTPFGTCRVYPRRNGVRLYEYIRGQRDAILISAGVKNPPDYSRLTKRERERT